MRTGRNQEWLQSHGCCHCGCPLYRTLHSSYDYRSIPNKMPAGNHQRCSSTIRDVVGKSLVALNWDVFRMGVCYWTTSPPLVQGRRGWDSVIGSDQSTGRNPSQRLTDFLLESAMLSRAVRNKHVNRQEMANDITAISLGNVVPSNEAQKKPNRKKKVPAEKCKPKSKQV